LACDLLPELEGRGQVLKTVLWSSEVLRSAPDVVQDVHVDFFRAGADIVTTSSYQLSVEGLAACGSVDPEVEFDELLRRSVDIACEARRIVLGDDCGPEKCTRRLLVRVRSCLSKAVVW
jgi:homocysteine S-methyltransferase